jgi:hypothetical protein
VSVSQLGHCTCLRLTSYQPHGEPRLAFPCRVGRGVSGCGFGAACMDSHRARGHGRWRDRGRCRQHGGPWHEVAGRGRCIDNLNARRTDRTRAKGAGLNRGTGADHRAGCPRNERGTVACHVDPVVHPGTASNLVVSGCVGGVHPQCLAAASRPQVSATGISLDVCRFGQHHRFVQSEAGELPLRFPPHPS